MHALIRPLSQYLQYGGRMQGILRPGQVVYEALQTSVSNFPRFCSFFFLARPLLRREIEIYSAPSSSLNTMILNNLKHLTQKENF